MDANVQLREKICCLILITRLMKKFIFPDIEVIQMLTKESLDITWSKYLSNDWIPMGKSGQVSFPVDKFYVDVDWENEEDWIGEEEVEERHQTFLNGLRRFFMKRKSKLHKVCKIV